MYPWLHSQLETLRTRAQNQSLHHGLLFVADAGAGEEQLIEQLAKTLVCEQKSACGVCKGCSLYEAHSHPDILEVVSEKASIGIDLIRKVSEFVSTTSQLMGNKVIVIHEIDRMTESASNSLLKTLEEPSSNTFLLMSSSKPDDLLATIKSRCEKIRINLPSQSISLNWLEQQSSADFTSEGLSAYADSPIYYLQAVSDSSPDFHSFSIDLGALSQQNVSAFDLAKKWQQNPEQALKWAYQWSVAQYREMLKNNSPLHELVPWNEVVNECVMLSKKIAQAGINKQLILQNVFTLIKNSGVARVC